MNSLEKIMAYNEDFVLNKGYLPYQTATKYPVKEMVIVSCMDTRLTELLPRAMNIANGDAKIIKVAGAVINHPFGSVMRSIVVAVHVLGAEEVFVVGHDDCGMSSIDPGQLVKEMIAGGIEANTIDLLERAGIDVIHWLKGFEEVEENVRNGVELIRSHPLMPKQIKVSGLVMNPETGQLRLVVNGSRTKLMY